MTPTTFRIVLLVLTILGVTSAIPTEARTAPAVASTDSASDRPHPEFLKLSVDAVTPGTITTTSSPIVTVTGTVTNIGDRMVDDIGVRLQRAPAIQAGKQARSSLQLDQTAFTTTTPFQDITKHLPPGGKQQFTMKVAVRRPEGASQPSLQVTDPGVYPVLLNVNAKPTYGKQAHLDDARFLLPVLGLPANPGTGQPPIGPPPLPPLATTMIWPLADRSHLVPGKTGTVGEPALLTDDDLAPSLTNGRLAGLLSAIMPLAREHKTDGPPANDPSSGVCLAIDPDLLTTVKAMSDGYRVVDDPGDPQGATHQGTGVQAATNWLHDLQTAADSLCTVALPFAQVDLEALAALNDPALNTRAVSAPSDLIDAILHTKSVRHLGVPDTGTLGDPAGRLLRDQGVTTALVAADATTAGGTDTPHDLVRLPGIAASSPLNTMQDAQHPTTPTPAAQTQPATDPALHAASFDNWSATALAAVGANPMTPTFTPASVHYDLTRDSGAARLQDALATMSFSALRPNGPRSLLLVPPQQWNIDSTEASTIVEQFQLLLRTNLATPRSLTQLMAQPPDPTPQQLTTPNPMNTAAPARFLGPVRVQEGRIRELLQAMAEVPESELTPRRYLTPLRDDLLRTLSLSGREGGDIARAETLAGDRLARTTRALDDIYRSVSVLPPGGAYTLASEQSPLLLVVRNKLPVPIRVRFRIDAPAHTKITDLGEQQLPARGARSFRIPTEVTDSRRLVIPISLSTPEGVPLGATTAVSVRSNAYGQILTVITGLAALLLFGLAGRRLWRRFHGRRAAGTL